MGEPGKHGRPISLDELIKYLLAVMPVWSARRDWGEIRIPIQNGQPMAVLETRSYRSGQLPGSDSSSAAK
jgi:hypothetical protein